MASKNLTWLLLTMTLLLSLPAFGESAQGKCSLATLKGTYGGFQQGTVVAHLPGAPFPSSEIATVTHDGAGYFTFTFTANLNGVVSSGTGSGTYSVKSDCSYSAEFLVPGEPSAHFAGAIGGAGMSQRVDSIAVDPWVVSSGTVKKIPDGGCSLATLKGTFRGITQGMAVGNFGFPVPTPFPGVIVQSVTFDGVGNIVAGGATINFGGIVFTVDPLVGTYTVNHDCTYSDSFAHVGVITGAGIMQELDYIFSTSTDVAVGIVRR